MGAFRCWKPGPPLSPFVDIFWTVDGHTQPHARERVLPTGTTQLVFNVSPNGRPESIVVGPRSEFTLLDTATSCPITAFGVHFKPGGSFPFVRVPGGELCHRSVALVDVWGSSVSFLWEQLYSVKTPDQRFRMLESALLDSASGVFAGHRGVHHALRQFRSGRRTVSEVVQQVGLSHRRFAELFRDEVGLSPKEYCRVQRFGDVLKKLEDLTDPDWTDLALACGYFDQAHFNHDFRAFSGINPSTYLRRRVSRTHVAIAGTLT